MIKKLIKHLFKKENKEKKQMLRILNNRIANSYDYEEMLELIKLYNKVKYENKTD